MKEYQRDGLNGWIRYVEHQQRNTKMNAHTNDIFFFYQSQMKCFIQQ